MATRFRWALTRLSATMALGAAVVLLSATGQSSRNPKLAPDPPGSSHFVIKQHVGAEHPSIDGSRKALSDAVTPRPEPPAPPAPNPTARAAGPATNGLAIPSIGLDLAIGSFAACGGEYALPRATIYRNRCSPPGVTVLLGHSPGPFSSLLSIKAGDLLVYWDEGGRQWRSHAQQVRVETLEDASTDTLDGSFPHLVLVTCATPDGSRDLVVIGSLMAAAAG